MAESKKGLYYLKDKKARVYHPISVKTSSGRTELKYLMPVSPDDMWCYSRQLTQDQLFAAHAWLSDEKRLFVFNFYSGVKLYDVVKYKGNWYEVTRVDTTDDYNGELFVYVKDYKNPSTLERLTVLEYGSETPTT